MYLLIKFDRQVVYAEWEQEHDASSVLPFLLLLLSLYFQEKGYIVFVYSLVLNCLLFIKKYYITYIKCGKYIKIKSDRENYPYFIN